MKTYIAGKITDLDKQEYLPKFKTAELELRAAGLLPVNPCTFGIPENASRDFALKICLPILKQCKKIYMLHDWQQSPGAVLERQFAIDNKIEVIYQNRHTALMHEMI